MLTDREDNKCLPNLYQELHCSDTEDRNLIHPHMKKAALENCNFGFLSRVMTTITTTTYILHKYCKSSVLSVHICKYVQSSGKKLFTQLLEYVHVYYFAGRARLFETIPCCTHVPKHSPSSSSHTAFWSCALCVTSRRARYPFDDAS